jgi:TolA-binding protein
LRWLRWCPLIALCLVLTACRKHIAAPALPSAGAQPASPDYLDEANRAFARADYAEAVRNYERCLEVEPAPQRRDEILFRLAVSYAVTGSAVHDIDRALKLLNEIQEKFPTGPWHDQAQLLLAMQETGNRLGLAVAERDKRIAAIESDLATLTARQAECRTLVEQLQSTEVRERKEKDARIRQLSGSIEELQEKIHGLTVELEALKKIDMQRRPSRPPP